MENIFRQFSDLLAIRFDNRVFTTEDSIRYTFFASMLVNYITPDEIILEFPHPEIKRAQIDTWLPSYKRKPVAIEFKYDRDRPGLKNKPRTMQAGQAFKDIYRLSLLKNRSDNFFIYVTTNEMHTYYNNAANGHSEFFNLPLNDQISIDEHYFPERPNTFRKAIGCQHFSAVVKSVFYHSLPDAHELRIYKVNPVTG